MCRSVCRGGSATARRRGGGGLWVCEPHNASKPHADSNRQACKKLLNQNLTSGDAKRFLSVLSCTDGGLKAKASKCSLHPVPGNLFSGTVSG